MVKILPSGWLHIRLSGECWAQVPPGWADHIPDEYIFNPAWTRNRVNEWWRLHAPLAEERR